jgi:hypothetical protein
MTPRSIILSRAHTMPSSTEDRVLATARASLKHTSPPVEAPINPLIPRARRTGKPTVALSQDKMAAFLQEMKSVRLRKVYHNVDNGREREFDPDASFAGANATFAAPPSNWAASWKGKEKEGADREDDDGARFAVPDLPQPLRRRATIGGAAPSPATTAKGNTGSSHLRKEGMKVARKAGGVVHPHAPVPERNVRGNTEVGSGPAEIPATNADETEARFPSREKRKRQHSDADDPPEQDPIRSAKKGLAEDFSSRPVTSSASISSVPSASETRQPTGWLRKSASASSFRPSRIPRLAASADADQATPSLSSDNEGELDHETSSDKMPPTPPVVPASAVEEARPSIELDAHPPASALAPSRATRDRQLPIVHDDVFSKRPPSSPIPRDTPSRPRPPSSMRKSRSNSQPISIAADDEDDNDPLAIHVSRPVRTTASKAPLRDAQPFKPKRRPRDVSSPPPRQQQQQRLSSSIQLDDIDIERRRFARASKDQNVDKIPEQTPDLSRSVRRASLAQLQQHVDEEYRREEDSFWGVLEDDEGEAPGALEDLDSGTLVGVGSRSKNRGFLAHGGAGGPSVFMGVGYVEGVQETDEVPC